MILRAPELNVIRKAAIKALFILLYILSGAPNLLW
jgi:hypothetical protein